MGDVSEKCEDCGGIREHRGNCLPKLTIKEARTGLAVSPIFDLTDYGGEPFTVYEDGIVDKVTRSTVHVRDPRGHVHIRYCHFFTAALREARAA